MHIILCEILIIEKKKKQNKCLFKKVIKRYILKIKNNISFSKCPSSCRLLIVDIALKNIEFSL